ncbi:MAG: exodeoxyribonuclease VII large subunit, partial [Clostridia bacterium]|nr:exodeoxyribonuclease VII large subunit [Clostridia bacterium]
SDESKRAIPRFPKRIAVVTSETGAAVQDIMNILSRRWKPSEIMLCPVLVQGENAANDMIKTLDRIYKLSNCDLIIIGRGGGSIEDLWAFNNEALARKIYESPIPVISAVGHETDFTICDFVADLRAPTPSAAAELAVPDSQEYLLKLNEYSNRFKTALKSKLDLNKSKYLSLANSLYLNKPLQALLEKPAQEVDSLYDCLLRSFEAKVSNYKARLSQNLTALDALSPLKVLARGYSVAKVSGKTLTSVKNAKIGDNLTLRVSDGILECEIKDIGENNGK